MKTQANIGKMILDSVIFSDSPDAKDIEIGPIVETCKRYKIDPNTLNTYLGGKIQQDLSVRHNKKVLVLSKREVMLIREIYRLYDNYDNLTEDKKELIKLILIHLGHEEKKSDLK